MALLTGAPARRAGSPFPRGLASAALWILYSWGIPTLAAAQSARASEYELKAVFLFRFAEFVDWPPTAFRDGQAPVVIGVLGNDPFGAYLDNTVRGEEVGGRPFEVRRYRDTGEIKACQILFISQSERNRVREILADLKGATTLTVSDLDGFDRSGGMIRLATEQNKIRLKINLDAATAAHLTLSSKLLRSADVVGAGTR